MSETVALVSTLGDLDQTVAPGSEKSFRLTISESYTGFTVRVPVHVRRAAQPGPKVFVTAALHGNEINGAGAVRQLIQEPLFRLVAGTLVMVPVVNVLGFETYSRYLPDRRDLNRCFPGLYKGSLASRMARKLFDEIVLRCDFGVDLHTAALRRTNFPNVRGDFSHPDVWRLAHAFGCQWMINSKGPRGSLRREATAAGCPTIILEAGEVWKVEPSVLALAARGVRNVLATLGMIDTMPEKTCSPAIIQKTRWIRAETGGFLHFHVSPGEIVHRGQPLATNTSLFGTERDLLTAPVDAVVMGMTTLPAASPGEPVVHLGELPRSMVATLQQRMAKGTDDLHQQALDDLATNVVVVQREEWEGGPPP